MLLFRISHINNKLRCSKQSHRYFSQHKTSKLRHFICESILNEFFPQNMKLIINDIFDQCKIGKDGTVAHIEEKKFITGMVLF